MIAALQFERTGNFGCAALVLLLAGFVLCRFQQMAPRFTMSMLSVVLTIRLNETFPFAQSSKSTNSNQTDKRLGDFERLTQSRSYR